MTPEPLMIPTGFALREEYNHVHIFYEGERVVGIIEAVPPGHLRCAASVESGSVTESRLLDWTEFVINTIKKDNGQ